MYTAQNFKKQCIVLMRQFVMFTCTCLCLSLSFELCMSIFLYRQFSISILCVLLSIRKYPVGVCSSVGIWDTRTALLYKHAFIATWQSARLRSGRLWFRFPHLPEYFPTENTRLHKRILNSAGSFSVPLMYTCFCWGFFFLLLLLFFCIQFNVKHVQVCVLFINEGL